MRRTTLLMAVALATALVSGKLFAGVEPQPFRSLTNKLEAVALVMESVDMRLENVLIAHPPDPNHPPDPTQPVVNKLEAMSTQLDVLLRRTADVIDTLPPSSELPELSPETAAALVSVRTTAFDLALLAHPPDPFCPTDPDFPPDPCEEYFGALAMVEEGALAIVGAVDAYLRVDVPE